MTDADADGWGDNNPGPGVEPGTDCNDSNEHAYPGAAEKDSADACMQDADCQAGQLCVDGACQCDPKLPDCGGMCDPMDPMDPDCQNCDPADPNCGDGVCDPMNPQDPDCQGDACVADSDCGAGQLCKNGVCQCDPNDGNCADNICDPMNPADPDCGCQDPNDPNCKDGVCDQNVPMDPDC